MFPRFNLRVQDFPEIVKNFQHSLYAFIERESIYRAEIAIKQCDCKVNNLRNVHIIQNTAIDRSIITNFFIINYRRHEILYVTT